MAETDTEPVPNGTGGLSAEEDDERLKQRPADIDADVREMERRKRVEAIMSSKLFREELERVLDQQLNEGGGAAPLLQRIREMVGGAGAARLQAGAFKGGVCVLPINDIRGIEGMGYEKGEKILRCKLAAVYRLVDLYGWMQAGLTGHITARLNTADEHFLTVPRGLLPHEVTASSLVKVDMQGAVQDQGTTNFPINLTAFSLHASVHAARPDVRCVLHVRSPAALAVSAQKDGLLPLCGEAALLGDLAYHHLPPGILDNEERDKLVRALGPTAKVLVLSNGGALCCGETLEEAFYQAKCLTAACDVQLRLASIPRDNLHLLDQETRKQIYDASRRAPADGVKWRVGGEEFEALMRMLDNAGYRTGYIYRHALVKGDVPKPKNDVEVPPAVSSLGYLLEEEELYRQGLWKKMDGRKAGDRTRWLNSPNVYQKVEVLETGTTDPKKITKWVDANNEEWVQDGSPAHSSTPVKIDAALQFVPKNTNPKEFKKLQQQIKDNRRADKISAGPQSHILEGVTWDEANKLNEDAAATHTGDHVVLMGAASKGIIQRGYQHNATVYSAPYARNPFDSVSDRELDEYKRTIERKARGEYDADVSESEGVSAAQLTSPDCQPSETEEESRDEHRILRIETKHAPKASQPEVVLSDDSTADFLAIERRAAEHTAKGDSAIFSDDEVFIVTRPSPVGQEAREATAAPAVRVGGGVLADGSLLVRSYTAPVQQNAVRDNQDITKHAPKNNPPQEDVTSASQHSRHKYSRSPNFQRVVNAFESPESLRSDSSKQPFRSKCKKSLYLPRNKDDDMLFPAYSTDRSSVLSPWFLDWDPRKDQWLRTRSLPRSTAHKTNLYRTQSHAGLVGARNPEPTHFHLPRCRSCDAYNVNYAWEVISRKLAMSDNTLCPSEFNSPKDWTDTAELTKKGKAPKENGMETSASLVKVKTSSVPLLNVLKINMANIGIDEQEFFESQEFSDDGYLDTGGSFTSEMTVIERISPVIVEQDKASNVSSDLEHGDTNEVVSSQVVVKHQAENGYYSDNSIEAEFDSASDRADEDLVEDLQCGEYMNFSDEIFDEGAYESPVKDLVQKDIRNYTVPMNVYCDDFTKFVQSTSLRRSPSKMKPTVMATVLEPIMEESKSSYGEETSVSISKTDNTTEEVSNNRDDEENAAKDTNVSTEIKAETIIDIVTIVNDIAMSSTIAIEKKDVVVKKSYENQESDTSELVAMATEQYASDSEENYTVEELPVDISEDGVSSVFIYKTSNLTAVEPKIIQTDENKDASSLSTVREITGVMTQDCESFNEKSKVLQDESGFEFKLPKNSEINKSDHTHSTIRDSCDSTAEFERMEAVSEVISNLLDRASIENQTREALDKENKDFLNVVSRHKIKAMEALHEQTYEEQNFQLDKTDTSRIYHEMSENEMGNECDRNIKEAEICGESREYMCDKKKHIVNEEIVEVLEICTHREDENVMEKVSFNVKPADVFEKETNTEKCKTNCVGNFSQTGNTEDVEFSNEILEVSVVRSGELSYVQSCSQDIKATSSFEDTESKIVIENIVEDLLTDLNHTYLVDNEEIEYQEDSLDAIEQFLAQNKDNFKINNIQPIMSNNNDSQKSLKGHDNDEIVNDIQNNKKQDLGFEKDFTYKVIDENGNFAADTAKYILDILIDGSIAQYENLSNTELDLSVSKISQDQNPMDVAFVESYHESITSSPINQTPAKIAIDESPIKKETPTKACSFMDSPFIKKAHILTMSHMEQSGGVTFWVSFNDSLSQYEHNDNKRFRRTENFDDKTPSFLCTDLSTNTTSRTENENADFTADSLECVPDLSNDFATPEFFKDLQCRASVLCRNELAKSAEDCQFLHSKLTDSFETAVGSCSGTFLTCASAFNSQDLPACLRVAESDEVDFLTGRRGREAVRKVYDSSKTGRVKRGSSWPPFEDTLFYRILSKFRMSESFDPSEFERLCLNS